MKKIILHLMLLSTCLQMFATSGWEYIDQLFSRDRIIILMAGFGLGYLYFDYKNTTNAKIRDNQDFSNCYSKTDVDRLIADQKKAFDERLNPLSEQVHKQGIYFNTYLTQAQSHINVLLAGAIEQSKKQLLQQLEATHKQALAEMETSKVEAKVI